MNLTEREAPKPRLQPLIEKQTGPQDHDRKKPKREGSSKGKAPTPHKETNKTKRKKPNREGSSKGKATTTHKETRPTEMNLTEREAPKLRLQPFTKKQTRPQDHHRKKPNREGTLKDKATTPHKETNKTTAERNPAQSKASKTRLQRPIKPIPHKLVQPPLESLE